MPATSDTTMPPTTTTIAKIATAGMSHGNRPERPDPDPPDPDRPDPDRPERVFRFATALSCSRLRIVFRPWCAW
jgi:hypothetical protein